MTPQFYSFINEKVEKRKVITEIFLTLSKVKFKHN
jgi:hypothetical protein